MEKFRMWDIIPGKCESEPDLEYYKAENKKTDAVVIIFPGGGYVYKAPHEGEGYAKYINSLGMDAFVLQYRTAPHYFPLPLVDARRSIRWVRHNAEKFGINADKIAVMGSSAGGHLAALVSTYRQGIEFEDVDEIDKEDYLPNYQILCYPVIKFSDLAICHIGSIYNLVGSDEKLCLANSLDPTLIADSKTPQAFIWHTSEDETVNVINSLSYGTKLRELGIRFEMHIFPDGRHGLGLAQDSPHVATWAGMLKNWFIDRKLL